MYRASKSYKSYVLCVFPGLLLACMGGCRTIRQEAQIIQPDESHKVVRILFLGNSYTFFNDLPDMLANLAQAGGHQVETAMLARGGWTLSDHAGSQETLEMIHGQSWDYVVFQEQSVIPSDPDARQAEMYPAVRLLNSEISSMGAKTVLFVTWGRRDGLPQSGFADFHAMQAALTQGYLGIADELNVMVAPAGDAWASMLDQDPQVDLWQLDGSHPGVAGTYLSACVFYAVIFQESPEGLSYKARLDEGTALRLQSAATQTVFQNLERWHIK